ncbi:hypothetical protein D5086_022151 [Populus alba]|uniref:Uncharacterized protein n=1 Tax=Populus alba TaxID=43335 RepID=A0ACC4BE71_POPAL
MAVEEAIARRVAQLISGCCWCWPWFNRGGAASCWDFSREAGLRFWCCFSITVGGKAKKEKERLGCGFWF